MLNSPEHRALALEVARKAVALQRDNASLLPLQPSKKILVVVPPEPTRSEVVDDQLASSLLDAVKQFAPSAVGTSSRTAVEAARSADVVVLGTFDLARNAEQQTLAAQLATDQHNESDRVHYLRGTFAGGSGCAESAAR